MKILKRAVPVSLTASVTVLALLAAAPSQAGLYIGGWDTGSVYSVDLDAQSVTTVASGFSLISGMEGIGDDDLYVFDQSDDVVTKIDPVTGSPQTTYSLAALGINVTGEGTFAMHSDLTGFTSTSSGSTGTYFSFDLTAGTSTALGTGISFDGVDFTPDGILYGLTQSSTTAGGSELHVIDPLTGITTLVGSTGIENESLAGLVVAEGDFIAAIGSSLYEIDHLTGAATFLFNPGIGNISGAAFLGSLNPGESPQPDVPSNDIPEPMPLALMALGMLGLIMRRRAV